MSARIVIAGGGTAGHVFPGIALAVALRGSQPDVEVSFVGTERGIETAAVPAAGYRLDLIDVVPWSSSLGAKRFLAPPSLIVAIAQAERILARARADVVVGMGAYASVPVVIAARRRRLPVIIHEQNAIPGFANLLNARIVRDIALTFAGARPYFPKRSRIRVTGNPIRTSIATLDRRASRAEARTALGLKPDVPCVVVFGGSLGATRLNAAALDVAASWRDRADRQMLLLSGTRNDVAAPAGAPVIVRPFLDQMEIAYAAADVAVARAGSASIAELAVAGVPSLLVPYPYARRDHQTANARALAGAGGALVLPDGEATAERIGRMIEGMLSDPVRNATMGEAAKRFGKPRAAADLAAWVLEKV